MVCKVMLRNLTFVGLILSLLVLSFVCLGGLFAFVLAALLYALLIPWLMTHSAEFEDISSAARKMRRIIESRSEHHRV